MEYQKPELTELGRADSLVLGGNPGVGDAAAYGTQSSNPIALSEFAE